MVDLVATLLSTLGIGVNGMLDNIKYFTSSAEGLLRNYKVSLVSEVAGGYQFKFHNNLNGSECVLEFIVSENKRIIEVREPNERVSLAA